MRGLEINLAAEPYRNELPLAALLASLTLIAFGLTGWGSYSYFTASSRRAALEANLAGHSRRMVEMKKEADKIQSDLTNLDEPLLTSQARFVDGILDQRNFSWTGLFNVLEKTVPWNVRLTAIRPMFKNDPVALTLHGTAQDLDALLDFQNALLHSPYFRDVIGHYERDELDQRFSFRVTATYVPELARAPEGGAPEGGATQPDQAASAPKGKARGAGIGGARAGVPARATGPSGPSGPSSAESPRIETRRGLSKRTRNCWMAYRDCFGPGLSICPAKIIRDYSTNGLFTQ